MSRLQAARALFDECVALAPVEREARLAACDDPELRDDVRRLLEAHQTVEASGTDPFVRQRLPPLPPPETVGPYRILERLGEGSMGEVFLAAQHAPVRRQVAIKIIKVGMDTREVIARFEMERQTLALMSHANVARMLDAGATDTGRPYFVMEYVAGIPITRYCDERRLDVPARLRLFMQVCAGVQHAHHRGIIHRDLKPSNVLVAEIDGEPVPKIIDFGIAKATAATENSPHTRLGHLLGTPGYMSPEQAELSPLDVDTRTDVYSLGALLYELLTGTLPIDVDPATVTPAALARTLQTRDVELPSRRVLAGDDDAVARAEMRGRTPRRLSSELAGDLDWIALRALARDRRHRYDSAAELCRDAERYLANEPVSAGPPSALYRARKLVRRHRVLFASGAALVAASLAFGWLMALQARETARERDRAELAAATSQRVSSFLIDLFRVSNPGESRGDSVTARELLDSAAERLQHELDDQPLVRSRMQLAIGDVYMNLGLYSKAKRQFEMARDGLAGLPSVEPADRLAAERGLGRAAVRLSNFAEAEPALRRVLDEARRSLGESHTLYADVANDLASLCYFTGRNDEAIEMYETAYRARSRAYGPNEATTLQALTNKAVVLATVGRSQDAETAFRDVAARLTARFGADHPATLNAQQNLANLYSEGSRSAEAFAIYESLVPRYRRVMGETHPDTLIVTGNYASRLRASGRHEEAYRLHGEVVRKLLETLGPDSRTTMTWELHLARDLDVLGRRPEAERMMREILSRQMARFGPDNPDTIETQVALGHVLVEARRYEEARTLLTDTLQRARRVLGPKAGGTRSALLILSELEYAADRPQAGANWWEQVIEAGAGSTDLEGLPVLTRLRNEKKLPGA